MYSILKNSLIFFQFLDLDPWSSGGVLGSVNENLVVIVIENGAHHLGEHFCQKRLIYKKKLILIYMSDLRSSNPNDTQSVKDARLLEIKTIKKWIQDYRQKLD